MRLEGGGTNARGDGAPMLTQPTDIPPLHLVPVVREFVADALTPISAYLALATPGRSCLLEWVEGTDRIARYSFIGLDYLETATMTTIPTCSRASAPRSRATGSTRRRCRFPEAPSASSPTTPRACSKRSARNHPRTCPFADALVVVPGTWVVFDHFTHKVTLIGLARSDDERRRRRRRGSTRYIAHPARRTADDSRQRARQRRPCGSRWTARNSSLAWSAPNARSTKATSTNCSWASVSRASSTERRSTFTDRSARAIPRRTCSTSRPMGAPSSARRRNFWCGWTARARAFVRSRARVRAVRRPSAMSPSATNCSRTKRNAQST